MKMSAFLMNYAVIVALAILSLASPSLAQQQLPTGPAQTANQLLAFT